MTHTAQFRTMPLLRQFFMLDIERGTMLRHEVRRDPATGMTLTRACPADLQPTINSSAQQGAQQHNGKAGST